jgi:Tfp pilus assembly protein PilE
MARGVALLSLLVALVVAGFMLNAQLSSSSAQQPTREVTQAQQAADAVTLQQAAAALEQTRALNGTYAGASLSGFDVTLAQADASSYCIQTATAHLTGPQGAVQPGPC